MTENDLKPLARLLLLAYAATAAYSRNFKDEHGSPPSQHAKVHHLRSVVQALTRREDRFELDPDFVEFGRVLIVDRKTKRQYLLRSASMVAIERARRELTLFDTIKLIKSDVTLLVYAFTALGLELAVAETIQRPGKSRLLAGHPPQHVGIWTYDVDDEQTAAFDQDSVDDFDELGNPHIEGEEETGE